MRTPRLAARLAASLGTAVVTLALGAGIAFPVTASAGYLGYSDIPADHWAAQSHVIDYASGRGLLTGYSGSGSGKWGPNDQVTRGQLAMIMYRVCMAEDAYSPTFFLGEDRPFTSSAGQVVGRFYESQMNWAFQVGLIKGSGSYVTKNNDELGWKKGTVLTDDWETLEAQDCAEPYVRGDDPITREELAMMLQRLAEHRGGYDPESCDYDKLDAAPDAGSVSSWAYDAMAWAVGNGLMGGAPGGYLYPQGTATRAEAAKMIMMYMKGNGFDPQKSDMVWVDGRVYASTIVWECDGCGESSAVSSEAIEHDADCPSLEGEDVTYSKAATDGRWIDLATATGTERELANQLMDEYSLLKGWFDWV